jgi:hypothetical protein
VLVAGFSPERLAKGPNTTRLILSRLLIAVLRIGSFSTAVVDAAAGVVPLHTFQTKGRIASGRRRCC